MRHKLSLLTVILLISVYQTNAQSLLWKISGNDLKKPSYLYGTIHLICREDLNISKALQDAFDQTEQLVLEIDMDAPELIQKMQTLSVNPEMKNISEQMSEELKKTLNDFFQKHYKSSLSQLGVFKPFVLQSMILQQTLSCAGAPASYEKMFMEISQKQEEEILGLEEIEDQFALFDKIPVKTQLKWLEKHMNDFENTKTEIQNLIDSYKKEDLQAIDKLTQKDPQFWDFSEDLLYNRNQKWVSRITTYACQKPSVFAVGAAHLPGKKGLINLLKKHGYTLTPIKQ